LAPDKDQLYQQEGNWQTQRIIASEIFVTRNMDGEKVIGQLPRSYFWQEYFQIPLAGFATTCFPDTSSTKQQLT